MAKKNPLTPPTQSLPSEQWFAAKLAKAEKRKKFWKEFREMVCVVTIVSACIGAFTGIVFGGAALSTWVQEINGLRQRVTNLEEWQKQHPCDLNWDGTYRWRGMVQNPEPLPQQWCFTNMIVTFTNWDSLPNIIHVH